MIHNISNGLQQKLIFYRAMAEIINLPFWNIFNFMKRYYFQEKRGNGYIIGSRDQRQRLGNRAYLMPLIWENDNIMIAKNERIKLNASRF